MPAPTGEQRKKCHAARDKYFACLSSNGNDESACTKEKDEFNSLCPATWVSKALVGSIYTDSIVELIHPFHKLTTIFHVVYFHELDK